MQAHILDGLRDPSLEDLYRKHYRTAPDICQAYVRMLAGCDPEGARRVAEEGRARFPGWKIAVPGPGAEAGSA